MAINENVTLKKTVFYKMNTIFVIEKVIFITNILLFSMKSLFILNEIVYTTPVFVPWTTISNQGKI